jgi:hypothetical protein
MTHRTTETDLGESVFTTRDNADMETRYLLIAAEAIEADFDSFTHEQIADLRRTRDTINAMILRGHQ